MFVASLLLLVGVSSYGCATVGSTSVAVKTEDSLIIYNPSTRIEHFIRRINFSNASGDFGFLVPVPSMPDIAAVDDKAFQRLEAYDQLLGPLPRVESDWARYSGGGGSSKTTVRVEKLEFVAGYEVAVLTSKRGEDLQEWLKTNKFPVKQSVAAWSQSYLDRGFGIVAFKFAGKHGEGASMRPKPVRLSFKTDTPFFPYREPKDAKPSSRYWKVYFASTHPAFAKFDDGSTFVGGRSANAYAMKAGESANFLDAFGLGRNPALPTSAVLTRFIVHSKDSRPDHDVIFAPVPWTSQWPQTIALRGARHLPSWNSVR